MRIQEPRDIAVFPLDHGGFSPFIMARREKGSGRCLGTTPTPALPGWKYPFPGSVHCDLLLLVLDRISCMLSKHIIQDPIVSILAPVHDDGLLASQIATSHPPRDDKTGSRPPYHSGIMALTWPLTEGGGAAVI